jgi:hypothetical protein
MTDTSKAARKARAAQRRTIIRTGRRTARHMLATGRHDEMASYDAMVRRIRHGDERSESIERTWQ